jgi:hypothetical protein
MTRTQCLGLMIRDMIEDRDMHLLDGNCDETDATVRINFVDVSDANNPVVHFDDGATLTVRVIAG